MIATLLAAILLAAAQPTPDDGPVSTAVPAAKPSALDEEIAPPKGSKPVAEEKTAPAAVAAAKTLTFEPKTLVQGDTLQVILGQRAIFQLDSKNQPVLVKVEEGKLADAHPPGAVTESFEAPADGQIAIALDGSAEKRATVLKVWNRTGKPIEYRAIGLVMQQGKVTPAPMPPGCAVGPRTVAIETWRRPIVAVGLARFKEAVTTKACQ
jgi:hypothetical protein